jgi:UDP-GlcNAc:undecaprenyl-phosphate GlcNAc-1-phosphate transferase
MSFLITFILSCLIVLVLVPVITAFAEKKGWYDSVGERKIHTGHIPRLGGVGIAAGFVISLVLSMVLINLYKPRSVDIPPSFYMLLACGLGFHFLGLVDDFRDLRGRHKFVVQTILAILVVVSGYYFRVVEIPIEPYRLDLGLFGPLLTVVWIVGVVNAVNLMDGMDGMASGIAFIGSIAWAMLYFKIGQHLPVLLALAAAGAILGFLFFNFPPASIFMGDSGSLFLGFILAVLPLLGDTSSQMQTGLIPAITICLIPILDTFAAILRRWRRGVSFFTPDRYHLHHKLLNLGFAPREVLAIIYGLCVLLGSSVLVGVYATEVLSFWLMMASWLAFGAIFVLLHFLKEKGVRFIRQKQDHPQA